MKSFRRDKLQLMFKSKFNFKDPSTCKRGQVKSKQQRTWSGINRPEVIGPATQWSGLVLILKNENLGQAREHKSLEVLGRIKTEIMPKHYANRIEPILVLPNT